MMKGGLARAEQEFAIKLTAPLYSIIRNEDGSVTTRNGSAFFLDAGSGPLGITASHVLEGLKRDRKEADVIAIQLGCNEPLQFDIDQRVLDSDEKIDIAIFAIKNAEIEAMGNTILTGHQKTWPPLPPEVNRGIYYTGYPGIETLWLSRTEISFGAFAGHGIATCCNDIDLSCQIEREHLIDELGHGSFSEQYDFGGMSGGPMLTVVEHKGIRSCRLGGVIIQGPNSENDHTQSIPGLEIIKARRADFILPNGQLNRARWNALA